MTSTALRPHPFGLVDWSVLAAYTGVLLGIGWYYARRQRTAEEYFVGNRSAGPFLAGLSMLASFFSVITYVATAGEYIQYGPTLAVGVAILSIPFLQVTVGRWLIPAIMRLPITSAYELLEARLGRGVRQLGSMIFIVSRLLWMALILYTGSAILINVLGCDPRWANTLALAIAAVTTTYTLMGGFRAVMVTEVVQFFVLLAGALLTIGSISLRLGGVAPWWPTHWEAHWPAQPLVSFNPHLRTSLALAVLSQTLVAFCAAGSNQSSVQRFLATRDAAAARRAYLLKIVSLAFICVVMGLTGAALLGFYRLHPEARPPAASFAANGDVFFPHYISHFLPIGVAGLVIAGILSAAMSGLSSGINSVITVLAEDFIELGRPGRSEATKLGTARWLAVGVGALVVVAAIGIGGVQGDLIEVAGKTVNLLTCPLFSLFFLAIFVRFSTPFGAIFGTLYGTVAAVEIAYWDLFTGQPKISFLWVGPVAFAVSLGVGCGFSLLPTRGRSAAVLIAWSAAALGLLAALAGWSLRLFS
jgi:SSS family solute:Na+ symporter